MLVPARGGSKGIPRKNLQLLGGKPLVAHAVEVGRAATSSIACAVFDRRPQIADAARAAGAEVPFSGPPELARTRAKTGRSSSTPWSGSSATKAGEPDLIVNLRPTSPLRTPSHVDDAIRLLLETGADSVKAVRLARQHPHKMWLRQATAAWSPT